MKQTENMKNDKTILLLHNSNKVKHEILKYNQFFFNLFLKFG